MDSQHSSNNELISIDTANVIFVLKGERYGVSHEAILRINPLNMESHEVDIEHIKGLYLKEYSNYEIIIQSKNNAKVEFFIMKTSI